MDADDEGGTVTVCATCSGDGQVEAAGGGWVDCPTCLGSGEKSTGATRAAPVPRSLMDVDGGEFSGVPTVGAQSEPTQRQTGDPMPDSSTLYGAAIQAERLGRAESDRNRLGAEVERLHAQLDTARAAIFHLAADIGDVTSRTSLGLLDLVDAQDELLQAAGRAEQVLPPAYFSDPPPRPDPASGLESGQCGPTQRQEQGPAPCPSCDPDGTHGAWLARRGKPCGACGCVPTPRAEGGPSASELRSGGVSQLDVAAGAESDAAPRQDQGPSWPLRKPSEATMRWLKRVAAGEVAYDAPRGHRAAHGFYVGLSRTTDRGVLDRALGHGLIDLAGQPGEETRRAFLTRAGTTALAGQIQEPSDA